MSETRNYICDVCGHFWQGCDMPPDEILGIGGEFGDHRCKIVKPLGHTCKAHICKKCVISIAKQAVELSSVDYDFSKLR